MWIKGKLDACERKIDLYQIGTDALNGEAEEFSGEFAAQGVTAKAEGSEERGPAAEEQIEDEVAFPLERK